MLIAKIILGMIIMGYYGYFMIYAINLLLNLRDEEDENEES